MTQIASTFLLELFTKVKNNVRKSTLLKNTKSGRHKISCYLATLETTIDERHLPMAFSSAYQPFNPSIECHFLDSCRKQQINPDDPNFNLLIEPILLRCGHIYHKVCLQLVLNI